MPINARNKGKEGEREFVNRFNMFFPDELKRNLVQTREGGSDITGCKPFCIEVKRVQKLDHKKWWRQVCTAACETDIAVVAYRQNNTPWRFLLPAHLFIPSSQLFVDAAEEVFLALVLETFK